MRLAHVEHAALAAGSSAHSSHHEYPESDYNDERADTPKEVAEESAFALVCQCSVESRLSVLIGFLHLKDELVEIVGRTDSGCYHWTCIGPYLRSFENPVGRVFLYVCFNTSIVVDSYLLYVSSLYIIP